MKTAVIIPLYNGGPWIEATLASVLAQTSPAAEIVVIDDGSTDGSVETVRKFPRVRLLANPLKGANNARSHGLSQTRAAYVAMLDQDDLWHPEHLASLEALLDENSVAPAALAGVERFQAPRQPAFNSLPQPATVFDPWKSFPTNHIWTPSQVLMRRDTLMAAGGWCVHLPGVADVHAWLRLSAKEPLRCLPRITVGYRQHPDSHSTQLLKQNRHEYLERFIAAGMENLPHRLRYHLEDSDELHHRLNSIRALSAWIRAAEAGSREEQISSATSADTILARQDIASVREILDQVLYFSQMHALEHSAVAKGFYLLGLAYRCPRHARKFRRTLLRLLWNHVKWHLGLPTVLLSRLRPA